MGLDIDDVIAKQEILDVIHRYCRGMDRIDDDLARSVWHPDGTAHYSGIYEGTGHGFVEWVSDFHQGLVSTSHQITNTLIEVHGDTAGSEAYVTVRLRFSRDDDSRFDVCGIGRYLDRWSRRDGIWAVDHRVYAGDQTWIEEVGQRSGVDLTSTTKYHFPDSSRFTEPFTSATPSRAADVLAASELEHTSHYRT